MSALNKLQEIINSAKYLTLKYQSGYTTGGRDYYECPCCGETVPYDDNLTMSDVKHESDCLYYLVMKLDKDLNNVN